MEKPALIFTLSLVRVWTIVISVFVCLSVCPLGYLENHTFKFHQICCTRCLWPWLSPLLTVSMQYVMYFRFCRWHHVFTLQSEWDGIKDNAYVSSSSPGGGISRTSDNVVWSSTRVRQGGSTGAKCAFSDCIWLTVLICYISSVLTPFI